MTRAGGRTLPRHRENNGLRLPRPAPSLQPWIYVLCPDCPPVRAARDIALSDSVWWYALVAVMPFVLVIIGIAVIARAFDEGESA